MFGPPTLTFTCGGFPVTLPMFHLREAEHFFRLAMAVTYSGPKYFSYVVLPPSLARHSVLSLNRRFLVSDWNKQNLLGQCFPFLPNSACVKRADSKRAAEENRRGYGFGEAKGISSAQDQPQENHGAKGAKFWNHSTVLAKSSPAPWPPAPHPSSVPRPLTTSDLTSHHLAFLFNLWPLPLELLMCD